MWMRFHQFMVQGKVTPISQTLAWLLPATGAVTAITMPYVV
jgi:hypothetical protein